MSSFKPKQKEGGEHNQSVTARRGRNYTDDHGDIIVLKSVSKSESRGSSADESEFEYTRETRACHPTKMVSLYRPIVVDLGMDVNGIFPATLEDKEKQILSVLEAARTSAKAKVNEQPINFGRVIPGVYRSSFPVEEDFKYLSTLGLKTVLSLVKKDFSPDFEAFMKQNGIHHQVIDMAGTKKVDIPQEIMEQIMEVVLAKENHPLLIHCNHGKHRTGCAVAVLRLVAGWNVDSILEEYRGFAAPKARDCDIKYINSYQVSSLQDLYVRSAKRARQLKRLQEKMGLTNQRMATNVIITLILMCIMFFTVLCW